MGLTHQPRVPAERCPIKQVLMRHRALNGGGQGELHAAPPHGDQGHSDGAWELEDVRRRNLAVLGRVSVYKEADLGGQNGNPGL